MTPYQQQPFYPQQMQQPQMMQPQMQMPPQAMQMQPQMQRQMQPQMMQPQFQQPMPKPTWVAQPKPMAPRPMAPRPMAPQPLATNAELAQNPNPSPKVRLQNDDLVKQASGKFVMPEPAALGLAVPSPTAPTATLDWNAIRARMHKLGVIGSHFDRAPQGGYRVIFTLPTAEPGRSQHIEAIGDNEHVAVQQALSRAEEFVGIR